MAVSNDEFDSAPEEVSLETSKQSILQTNKARSEAIRSIFEKSKEFRRNKDTRLKEQAKVRKSKAVEVVENRQDESILKADLTDPNVEALKQKGLVKIPKARTVGEQEKAALLTLMAERKARMGPTVARVSVAQSFRNHMYFKAVSK